MINKSSNRSDNPYVPLATQKENVTRQSIAPVIGKIYPIQELSIRIVGVLCFIGAVFSILVPESMDWIARSLVALMYDTLRHSMPGSLLMLLPYLLFGVFLFLVGLGLIALHRLGRIGATVVCGIGIFSGSIGCVFCLLVLLVMWSPKGRAIFSDDIYPSARRWPIL